MRKLAFAILAAMMVAACASTGDHGASNAHVAAGKPQYCWADRLEAIGSRFNCNWTASREEACAGSSAFSTVDGAGYAYPRVTTTCASGQRLLELVPRA